MLLRLIAIFLFSFLLVGCHTTSLKRMGVDSAETWDQIEESGIATDVSFNFLLNKVNATEQAGFFKTDAKKIYWWGHFTNNAFWGMPQPLIKFQAKWYAPNGEVYLEKEFKFPWGEARFAKTEFLIADTPVVNISGEWQVEIFYKEYLIDRKAFHLYKGELKDYIAGTKLRGSYGESAAAPISSSSGSSNEEDSIFQEKYAKAVNSFKQGNLSEARDKLQEILAKQPYRTEAHLALSSVYFKEGLLDESLAELDYVLQNPAYREQGMELRTKVLAAKENAENAVI